MFENLLLKGGQDPLTLPLEGLGRLSSRIGDAIEAGVAMEVVIYRTNTARGDEMLLISGAAMLEGA